MPSPNDSATLQAIGEGVEHARREAEIEWGFERLPLLVSDVLRAKFNRQKVKWSTAYREAWEATMLTRDQLAAVEEHAGGMKRAYAALAAAATEAGHRAIAPYVWEVPLSDGTVAAFVQTEAEASRVRADGRYLVVYTATEVGRIIDMIPESLQLAKVHFPGAKFEASTQFEFDSGWVKAGDEIPFPVGRAGEVAA